MSKYALITDGAALDKLSHDLATDIKGMDDRIQQYLMSEIAHIEQHRNPTRLNKFFSAIKGSAVRVNAMHNFMQVFANISWQPPEKLVEVPAKGNEPAYNMYYVVKTERKVFKWYISFGKNKGWKQSKSFADLLDAADQDKWTAFQPERAPRAYDIGDTLKNMVRNAIKALASGHKDNKIDTEILAGLIDLGKKAGLKVEDMTPDVQLPNEVRTAIHLATVDGKNVEAKEPAVETSLAKMPKERKVRAKA